MTGNREEVIEESAKDTTKTTMVIMTMITKEVTRTTTMNMTKPSSNMKTKVAPRRLVNNALTMRMSYTFQNQPNIPNKQ